MNESSDQSKKAVDPEAEEGKFFAAVGYIFFLCLVPLILKKGNKFASFHGKQGLVLLILEIAAAILRVVPVVGPVIATFAFVVFGILSLVGVLKVLIGEYWEMPVVYDIAKKINV